MKIDINCDVGEGISNEYLLMPYISSCNIACGGHFGNAKTIDKTIQLAIENKVLIGAHPSFPDTANFGRKVLGISHEELQKSIENQLNLFVERMSFFDEKMHHIKPHGALYNLIAVDEEHAKIFVKSIEKYSKDVFLYVPYGSVIEEIALENNIKIKYEAFADRNYNDNLTLVSRSKENAVITQTEEVFNHIIFMINNQKVKTISGLEKVIKVDTFCVHGDTMNSLEIVENLSKKLKKEGIKIGF
ncbi:MAG: 5-oxoprolinase subunit PxpA [Polaribacter sp.]|uniref:5-oxoprolinase subunit PxpA n=1 Tax=Polaribacter sp. TaxID=1920175 RepID=UPI002F358E4B